ncbi:MAG: nucleotide disphospho-sugar-binding domain-containing protein [Porticoccaceae bacterium]
MDAALKAGHQVTLAAKELQNIGTVMRGYPITVFQAPYLHRQPRKIYPQLMSYSQLILQRFETVDELEILCRAWDGIFGEVKPDLVIYDFAPSAMIASLHRPWQKWITGNGFLVPRTDLPYLGLFPRVPKTPDNEHQLRHGDARLLTTVNAVLARRGLSAIADVRDIITRSDRRLLLTLPELDHGGVRQAEEYLGVAKQLPGREAVWPAYGDCRVFAYLAAFPMLESMLEKLSGAEFSTLIYSRDINDGVKSRFPQIRFVDQPVDMEAVAEQADMVVNMAGHTTSAQCFMAGIPQLMIPLRQEQFYLASRVAAQGYGVVLGKDMKHLDAAMNSILALARAGRRPFDSRRRALLSGALLEQRLAQLFATLQPAPSDDG